MTGAVASLLAWAAGLFLLVDALAKANDLPFTVGIFGKITGRPALALPAVVGLGLAEAGLGGAVLAGDASARLMAAIFLLCVSAGSLLFLKRDGGDDCGCHGRAVRMTPAQSAMLAGVVAAVLVAAFAIAPEPPNSAALVATVAAATMATWGALGIYGWVRGPLVDFTRLKRGARFGLDDLVTGEAGDEIAAWIRGEVLVLAARVGCGNCHAWARVLAAASRLPDMPPLLVLLGGDGEASDGAITQLSGRLRIVPLAIGDFARMARRAPLAARVRGGVVIEVWDETLPDTIVGRLRGARQAGVDDPSV